MARFIGLGAGPDSPLCEDKAGERRGGGADVLETLDPEDKIGKKESQEIT